MKARFPADSHAPANARTFVSQRLSGRTSDERPPSADDVVLVVSELVTNCVRAGAALIDVALQVANDRVDLEVSDDASGWPMAQTAGPDDLCGRGLSIVEQIADKVSTTRRPPGKTVTATWFRRRG